MLLLPHTSATALIASLMACGTLAVPGSGTRP